MEWTFRILIAVTNILKRCTHTFHNNNYLIVMNWRYGQIDQEDNFWIISHGSTTWLPLSVLERLKNMCAIWREIFMNKLVIWTRAFFLLMTGIYQMAIDEMNMHKWKIKLYKMFNQFIHSSCDSKTHFGGIWSNWKQF